MKSLHNLTLALFLAAIVFAFAACSSMHVNSARDPQANLSQYSTYSWVTRTPAEEAKPNARVVDETVKYEADKTLPAKGLHKAVNTPPDLLVSYSAKTKTAMTYGVAPGPWGWSGAEEVYPTQEGSLTLQFIDPKTNRVVWQGTPTDALSDSGAQQSDITKAVQEIIQKYPAPPS